MSAERVGKIRACLDRGKFVEARGLLSRLSPGPSRWLLQGQLSARSGGDPTEDLEQVVACNPNAEDSSPAFVRDALLASATSHALAMRPATALEFARRAAALDPADVVARHMVASLGNQGAETPLHGEVKSLFDDYAGIYDHHLVDVLRYAGPKLVASALIKHGVEDMDLVVDLGCGTGLCGPGVRMFCEHLVGVDLSAEMVARCSQVASYDAVWQDDAVHALRSFQSGGADGIIAADVVGYIRDIDALFREVRRVLSPEGVFIFSVEAWGGSKEVHLSPSRRLAFAPGYVSRVATGAGLREVALEHATIRHEANEPVGGIIVTLAPG